MLPMNAKIKEMDEESERRKKEKRTGKKELCARVRWSVSGNASSQPIQACEVN